MSARRGVVVVAMLLVLSVASPAIATPIDEDRLVDDYEDGTVTDPANGNWTGSDGLNTIEADSDDPITGTYSVKITNDFENMQHDLERSSALDVQGVSYKTKTAINNDDGSSISQIKVKNQNGNTISNVTFKADNTAYVDGTQIGTYTDNQTVDVEISNIDYGANTYDISITGAGLDYSDSGVSMVNGATGVKIISLETDNFGGGLIHAWMDEVYVGNVLNKHDVTGTVTDDDGDPVEDATVETDGGTSTTTDSNGDYSLTLQNGDYNLTASKDGYNNQTKSVSINAGDETLDFSLQPTDPAYVSARSPTGGFLNITSSSVDINVTVDDDEGNDINATLFYNDGANGDGYQQVASETDLQPGEEINASVQVEFGLRQRYKVELDDGATTVNSSVYAFRPPGKFTILNGTDFNTLDTETVSVTFADADGSWTETRTTTDGQLNLTGLPKPWVVTDISASGFQDRQMLINDRAGVYFPVLYEDGTSGTYVQCFQLDDFTGNYKTTESGLQVSKRVDGEFEIIGSVPFDASGEACVRLEDGEDYNLGVINLDGDSRSTGGYEGNQSQDTVRLPIYDRRSGDAVTTTLYTWDAYWTEDSNGNREDISWSLDLAENVSATNVTLRIYERGNESNEIHNQTFGALGEGANVSHLELLDSEQQNQSWVVTWTADVNNSTGTQTVSARKVLGAGGQDQWPGMPDWIGHYAAFALLLMTGASITRADVKVGLLIVPALAGLLWFAGLLTSSVLTGGAVALALGLGAVLSHSKEDTI